MANIRKAADTRVQRIVDDSIQLAVGGDDDTSESVEGHDALFSWLVHTGDLVPPWWSRARDQKLAAFWKESNHLSIAVYNTQARIVGIPPRIEPTDTTITEHWAEAEELQRRLFTSAGFGAGWDVEYSKFVESLITQDNGAFMEIIGNGDPLGPIIGTPLSIRHLDSTRCTRTNVPDMPVIYTDGHGHRFGLHWTRVIHMSQMPSANKEMHGVGFCAVSRAINIAQTLSDIIRYKQERLGSRPHNQLVVGKGITGRQIMLALRGAEQDMSNKGFTRYAQTVVIGSENTNIGLELHDLTHMDPFDEETSINLGMFAIAGAFGMDADELWPVGGKSAGKAEANNKRNRSRGKLPTQITTQVASEFNYKVLPRHLKLVFDFRDDDEDLSKANVKDIRGRNRERDLGTGAINVRGARTRMLEEGDIDRVTFTQMEMADGRLQDGTPIGVLYFSDNEVYKRLLQGFMKEPLNIQGHIKTTNEFGDSVVDTVKLDSIVSDIEVQRQKVLVEMANTRSTGKRVKIDQSYWALDWLEQQYEFAAGRILPEVPMHQRRQRTDVRVVPAETSPEDQSPAEAAQGNTTENVNTTPGSG